MVSEARDGLWERSIAIVERDRIILPHYKRVAAGPVCFSDIATPLLTPERAKGFFKKYILSYSRNKNTFFPFPSVINYPFENEFDLPWVYQVSRSKYLPVYTQYLCKSV